MKQFVQIGTTSKRMVIFVQSALSTSGGGLTGLTNASSGLAWYWYSETSGTSSAVSIVGQTVGTWTSGGFVQIDSTHLPGFYELGIPNALLTGTTPAWVTMQIAGAANMVPVNVEIELTGFNPSTNTFTSSVVGTVTATVPTTTPANVLQWNSTNVATPNVGGVPKVDVVDWLGTAVTSSAGIPVVFPSGGTIATVTGTVAAVTTASNVGTVTTVSSATVVGTPTVNVVDWLGTAVTSNAGVPIVDVAAGTISVVTGTVTATVPTQVNANVQDWLGTAVTSNAGLPVVYTTNTVTATVPSISTNVNVVQWLGTAVTSNAGVPLVDVAAVTGTVTATVVGGTINTLTGGVTLSTGQLTVKRNTLLDGFTFPMYDATTGNLATGLTVSAVRTIDGGGVGGTTNSPTEVGSGIYKLNLSAGDLDGGVITLLFTAASASTTVITLITQT